MSDNLYQGIQTAMREHLLVILLFALFILQIFSFALLACRESAAGFVSGEYRVEQLSAVEESRGLSSIPKLSSFRGPAIDGEAAQVMVDESGETVALVPCETVPVRIWVFLVIAYLALLVFNLTYTFNTRTTLQWFWESVYTALALLAWPVWDGCLTTLWYPLAVLQCGIVVYVIYLYFFERRLRAIDFDHTDEPTW